MKKKDIQVAAVMLFILALIGGLASIQGSKADREVAQADQVAAHATLQSNQAAYANPARDIAELKKMLEQMKVREYFFRRTLPSGEIIESSTKLSDSTRESGEESHDISKPILPAPIKATPRPANWKPWAGAAIVLAVVLIASH